MPEIQWIKLIDTLNPMAALGSVDEKGRAGLRCKV